MYKKSRINTLKETQKFGGYMNSYCNIIDAKQQKCT